MIEKNQRWPFIATGPDTAAGRYLRMYWQPIYESKKLRPKEAVMVKVLSEEFTLYRGESGNPHLIAGRCSHRGTQLSTGWVEGEDLRCFYHGWKFNPDGQCIEQPAEPIQFCRKVGIRGYPTIDYLGLIFVYLGQPPSPKIPQWPEFESEDRATSIASLSCNYFQSAENIVDDIHVFFIHRARDLKPDVQLPRVSATETEYGIAMSYSMRDRTPARSYFLMPNSHYIPPHPLSNVTAREGHDPHYTKMLFWYVPIDDQTHLHVNITSGSPDVIKYMKYEQSIPHNTDEDIRNVLQGSDRFHLETNPKNRRPDMIRLQDGVAVVGQGAIADRSKDHLGATDAGVILLRKLWLRELGRLSRGETLKQFYRPAELPS